MRNNKILSRGFIAAGMASAMLMAAGVGPGGRAEPARRGLRHQPRHVHRQPEHGGAPRRRYGGRRHPGTPVDWEKNFGDGDTTRFRLDGYWRFAERHKVRTMWFNSSRSGSKTIDSEIEWHGETYPVNAKISGESKFNIIELAYEYAFMRRDNFELTGSAGMHYTDLSLSLSGEALDGEGGTHHVKKEGSVGAPLPVFGGRALWRMGGDFWLDTSVQWFALSIDEYDGSVWDAKIDAIWQPSKVGRAWASVTTGSRSTSTSTRTSSTAT